MSANEELIRKSVHDAVIRAVTEISADVKGLLQDALDRETNETAKSMLSSMLENVEEVGYRSPDASMSWIFEDGGLDTKVTGGTFTISKTLRTKIESILVKMITYWQQYFFRDVLEKNALRSGLMPVIDEDEAGDADEEPEDEGDMQDEDGPEVDLDDPDIQQAITIVRAENKATVGLLQRRMSVGYAKAARLIDALEELGVVGPYNGSDGREVLPTDEPDDTEGGED